MTTAETTAQTAAPGPGGLLSHPLVHAGRWLAADLLSTLGFVAIYAVTRSFYVAIGCGVALGVGQIAYLKMRRAPIDLMQWMSLAQVVVFGGASLLTRDPRFIMFKPTLIYAAIGAVMLRPGWMTRYLPPSAQPWAPDVCTIFGYVWASLMFLTGALNLILVMHADPKLWALWITVFPVGSKLSLFAIQYLTMRVVIRGRMAAKTPEVCAA